MSELYGRAWSDYLSPNMTNYIQDKLKPIKVSSITDIYCGIFDLKSRTFIVRRILLALPFYMNIPKLPPRVLLAAFLPGHLLWDRGYLF